MTLRLRSSPSSRFIPRSRPLDQRLGDGQYLVDFYLPDLKTWVEVKGRIEPRDDYLLKEVADLLKRERQGQLFVYTQSKAYHVTAREFKEITHKDLWELLV